MGAILKNAARPMLSDDAASKLLANVFDACEQEQNSIPLETLASYSEYRREKHGLAKTVLIIMLLIFVALPFCFISPEFTITSQPVKDPGRLPIYEVSVGGFLPVNVVTASVDGHGLTVFETGDRSFSVEPSQNGTMKVKVKLANRQYAVKEIAVEGIDLAAPTLVRDEVSGGMLRLIVTDDGTIDYKNIHELYNSDLDGVNAIYPVEYSEETGLVVFEFPPESMNVYVPDLAGNTLQLVITVAR